MPQDDQIKVRSADPHKVPSTEVVWSWPAVTCGSNLNLRSNLCVRLDFRLWPTVQKVHWRLGPHVRIHTKSGKSRVLQRSIIVDYCRSKFSLNRPRSYWRSQPNRNGSGTTHNIIGHGKKWHRIHHSKLLRSGPPFQWMASDSRGPGLQSTWESLISQLGEFKIRKVFLIGSSTSQGGAENQKTPVPPWSAPFIAFPWPCHFHATKRACMHACLQVWLHVSSWLQFGTSPPLVFWLTDLQGNVVSTVSNHAIAVWLCQLVRYSNTISYECWLVCLVRFNHHPIPWRFHTLSQALTYCS